MSNILAGLLGRKAGASTGAAPYQAPVPAAGLFDVNVIFTTAEDTVTAMRQAAQLASNLGARVRVFAPQVVSFHTDLDHPPVNPGFLAERYREVAAEAGVDTTVQILLCRDVLDGLRMVLKANSLVVVGGARHWWPTREQKLIRALESAGYQVLFVTKETTTCSTCSTSRSRLCSLCWRGCSPRRATACKEERWTTSSVA